MVIANALNARSIIPSNNTRFVLGNNLVREYLPLVRSIARRYMKKGLEMPDLMQEGMIGLVEAARRFDPGKGSFANYARYWIRKEILTYVLERTLMVKLPRYIANERLKIEEAKADFAESHTHEISLQELSEMTGISVVRLSRTAELKPMKQVVGKDPIESRKRSPLIERLPNKKVQNPEMTALQRNRIEQLTRQLDEREKYIVWQHYLLGVSVVKAGKQLGVGRGGAFKIKTKALQKIKQAERQLG